MYYSLQEHFFFFFLEAEICISFAWEFRRGITDGLNRNLFYTGNSLYFSNIALFLRLSFPIYFQSNLGVINLIEKIAVFLILLV